MAKSLSQLERDALQLPAEDRARLAVSLLCSLEDANEDPEEVEKLWVAEAVSLNHPVNDGWIWALGHMGDHSSLLGYGPEYFSFRGDRATIECPERIVQQVINHFKAWLPNANTVYKQKIERDLRESERALQSKLEQELSEARERVLRDINI